MHDRTLVFSRYFESRAKAREAYIPHDKKTGLPPNETGLPPNAKARRHERAGTWWAGDIDVMKRILAAYDAASSPAEWAECNRQFHLALCAHANNSRLCKMIEEYCLSTTNRYSHLRMSLDAEKNEMQSDHYAIVDACKRRAVDEVVALIERHILDTRREVMAAARLAGLDNQAFRLKRT